MVKHIPCVSKGCLVTKDNGYVVGITDIEGEFGQPETHYFSSDYEQESDWFPRSEVYQWQKNAEVREKFPEFDWEEEPEMETRKKGKLASWASQLEPDTGRTKAT